MLFLAGADHERFEKAKWTRQYLLGHRRILKKGRLYHTPVDPIFQKENGGLKCNISKPPFCAPRPNKTVLLCMPAQSAIKRKKPINRVPVDNGLSALRLCVWLFDNCCMKLFYIDDGFPPTLWTVKRKIFEHCIGANFCARFVLANRTENPISSLH